MTDRFINDDEDDLMACLVGMLGYDPKVEFDGNTWSVCGVGEYAIGYGDTLRAALIGAIDELEKLDALNASLEIDDSGFDECAEDEKNFERRYGGEA
jgi:hypothetical protein